MYFHLQPTDPILAMKVLNQLTPGSDLMKTNTIQDLKDDIPRNKRDELKALYESSSEMLRHYYACFPPSNADLENKLNVMRESLEAFYQHKILGFKEQLLKENFPWNVISIYIIFLLSITLISFSSIILR